jgi:hypothetical protein
MSGPVYVLLPRVGGHEVLLLGDGRGWTLPDLAHGRPGLRASRDINASMEETFGLRTSVLRFLTHADDPMNPLDISVYAFENLDPGWVPPAGGRWVSSVELDGIEVTPPELREYFREWFDAAEGRAPLPEGLPSWMRSGWHDQVSGWILSQLDGLGRRPAGRITKEKGWGISCLMRVPTDRGDLYYKASPNYFPHEPEITRRLSERFPDRIPIVLALDPERNGMLMEGMEGIPLEEGKDLEAEKAAIREFARLQIGMIPHAGELAGWGCMDRPLSILPEQMDRLWAAIQLPEHWKRYDLTAEQVNALLPLRPRLLEWFAELEDCGIPDTLIHGDLHGHNIMVSGHRFTYFDWSDAAVTPPFFDLLLLAGTDDPERREARVRAYLEPWAEIYPMDTVMRAFELSLTLGCVYHSLSYLYLAENMPDPLKWEMADGVGAFLRDLLKRLELQV